MLVNINVTAIDWKRFYHLLQLNCNRDRGGK